MRAVFATIGGLKTRALVAGSGPALILVQPVGYPADVFARTLAGLADRFTVVAPDVPGQGFSEPPAAWPAAPQVMMADHVLALADHLGVGRFSVLGSSLGGLVAALIARRAPERVDALVIVGSGSVFNDPAGQPRTLQAVYANGSRVFADPSLETCRARLHVTCHRRPEAEDILLTQITAYAQPGMGAAYKAIIDGVSATAADPEATVHPHLETLAMRSLVIVGEQDIRTSYAAHRAGAARMPDARILRLPDCGHLPFLELPEVFNDALARFLAGEAVGERPAAAAAD